MTQHKSETDAPVWLEPEVERHEPFGGDRLWIGRHTADEDVLVFDPTEEDASADVISLYSLTQHRTRSFPRSTVLARILPIVDDLGCARAKKEYAQREALRAEHEEGLAAALDSRRSRQRDSVLAAHRRYIEAIGLEYRGERETGTDHRPGRRTKCRACGIALDNFAGAVCVICEGVLCSCGACACRNPASEE